MQDNLRFLLSCSCMVYMFIFFLKKYKIISKAGRNAHRTFIEKVKNNKNSIKRLPPKNAPAA